MGRSVLDLMMGKFRQISTEFWPLIDVRNWFSFSIFGISLPIFFKLCMRFDIGKECLGIEDGLILSYNYRVAVLDLCSKLRFAQYLLNKWMDFDKIL